VIPCWVANKSSTRLLGVVSVDGVKRHHRGDATPAQSGYVLEPRGNVDISGWRKSMSEVAAFVFTAAARQLRGAHRPARQRRRDRASPCSGSSNCRAYGNPCSSLKPSSNSGARGDEARESASGAARDSSAPASPPAEALSRIMPKAEEKLGTGHGEREASAARWTDFRRASETPKRADLDLLRQPRQPGRARHHRPAPRAEPNPFRDSASRPIREAEAVWDSRAGRC